MIVLLASLVHTSAIIMLAVYFIANMKPWSGKMIGISFLFIVLMFSFTTIMPRVFSALNMYENYIDFLSAGGGVKTITVIVAFIPPVLAFVLKERLPKDDREFNCLINIVLVYALIYMVSFAQRYVARFAIYLLPWVIIFYTKLITHLRKERLSALVYYVLVVGYGVTMIYFTRKMEYAFMVRGPAGW